MLTFNFTTFPIIKTERLVLREITGEDLDVLFELRSNRNIMKNISKEPFKTMQEARDQLQRMQDGYATSTGISWGITLQGSRELIGVCGLWRIIREHYRAEIGYTLLPEYWNQGIMSEAIKAIIRFGFEQMEVHSIEANLNPDNVASARILEKAGFVKEGYFKENYYLNGKFTDTLTYSKVKDPANDTPR